MGVCHAQDMRSICALERVHLMLLVAAPSLPSVACTGSRYEDGCCQIQRSKQQFGRNVHVTRA